MSQKPVPSSGGGRTRHSAARASTRRHTNALSKAPSTGGGTARKPNASRQAPPRSRLGERRDALLVRTVSSKCTWCDGLKDHCPDVLLAFNGKERALMREILGRRRRHRSSLRNAALHCATQLGVACAARRDPWQLARPPPAAADATPNSRRPRCARCPDPECAVPGAHPFDPGLLAATTDARMVRWWWTNRPTAPLILPPAAARRAR